jgi:hypothetical protein
LLSGASDAPTEDSNYFTLNGNLYIFNDERNPTEHMYNLMVCNHFVYGRKDGGMKLGGNTSSSTAHYVNVVNLWEKRSSDHNTSQAPINIDRSPEEFPTSSEVFIGEVRAAEGCFDDGWDCATDADNQEADIKSLTIVPEAEPDGIECGDISALTQAENFTLYTQNVGPWPNARLTFLQDAIDDVEDGTGSIQNTYSPTPPADTSSAYSEPANPHEENGTTSRTNLEDDLRDKAEALYGN